MWHNIQQMNEKYNFKIKELNGNLIVDSGMDEWIIRVDPKLHPNHKNITLLHKNYKRDVGHYHFQRRFSNIPTTFKYIHKHENRFILTSKKTIKLNALFSKIYT